MLKCKNDKEYDQILINKIIHHDEMAFETLFVKYKPIVNKIWGSYYLNDFEIDDWYQEARIVMFKIIEEFDNNKKVSFGCYYRSSLKNRFFDLLRRRKAQKRIPDQCLTSFNANQEILEDILMDGKAACPEKVTIINSILKDNIKECSGLEKRVLISVLNRKSYHEIALQEHCSVQQIVNAFERCKKKCKFQ